MRILSLVLALGMIAPSKARARARTEPDDPLRRPPSQKQSRRRAERRTGLLQFAPNRSPCGRHLVEIDGGAVYVDGRRIHPELGSVTVLAQPIWRSDGGALAWLERCSGETRLVVLADLDRSAQPMAWPLPRTLGADQVHWAGDNRVVVGPELLQPRATASWAD